MEFDSLGPGGQMDPSLWLSAPFDQEAATPTGSQSKDKKGHCGGTLTAHGSELPSMGLSLFVLEKETPTHLLNQSVKRQFFLVFFYELKIY